MIFPVLAVVLVGMIALALRYRYLNKKSDNDMTDFFTREQIANSTPKKDISNLPYITINMDKFPTKIITDNEVIEIENHLEELSKKKILNLTQMTNTELKEKYGLPNFEEMQKIGENFNDLTVTLVDYASEFILRGLHEEAIKILEFGVVIKSDISKNYTLLADCYNEKGNIRQIQVLKEQVEQFNGMTLLKGSVIRHLDNYLSTEDINANIKKDVSDIHPS